MNLNDFKNKVVSDNSVFHLISLTFKKKIESRWKKWRLQTDLSHPYRLWSLGTFGVYSQWSSSENLIWAMEKTLVDWGI